MQRTNSTYKGRAAALFGGCLLVVVGGLELDAAPKKVVTIAGISEFRLDNGLRVLLYSDGAQPTVTVNMTVLVGSRHEGAGEGGMAHLLEHMLFKGTPSHPRITGALRARGAKFNATTNIDRTRYFETLPAGDKNLEFALRLEADRLVNSLIRKRDLDAEMTVVRNEFEIARSSSSKTLLAAMTSAAYQWHSYGKTTIGNQSDIERVPIEKLRRFYQTYYRPDNVVLIVGGKFDESRALAMIEKHFGRLPKPRTPLPRSYTVEPTQQGERVVSLQKRVGGSAIGMLFHVPAAAHPDFAPLSVLRDVLIDNPSGPFHRTLVRTGLSGGVNAMLLRSHDPGYLMFMANARNAAAINRIRVAMFGIFTNIATGKKAPRAAASRLPVRARRPGEGSAFDDSLQKPVDLSRLRNRIALAQLMSDPAKLVNQLSEWSAAGDWRLLFVHANRLEKVTPADVRRVAAKYLKRDNRTIGFYVTTRTPHRVKIPETPNIAGVVKDVRFKTTVSRGEAFEPTWRNLRARARFAVLPEGMKIAMLPQRTTGNSVTLNAVFRYGNLQSLKGKWCDFIPEYMLMGTKKHSAEQLRLAFTGIGSALKVSGGNGLMRFQLATNREKFPQALELLRQVLREPTLPPGELNKLKLKYFRKVVSRRPNLVKVAELLSGKVAVDDPRHFPAGRAGIARVRNMTHAEVRKIVDESLGAHAGELVIAGDFDAANTLKAIQNAFRGWKGKTRYEKLKPLIAETSAFAPLAIRRKGLATAYYDAALNVSISQRHADYPALMVASAIAGARLRERIREKEGFSYQVNCRLAVSPDSNFGRFTIAATCNPANMQKLQRAVRHELQRAKLAGYTKTECRRALASYLRQWETARSQRGAIVGMLGMCLVLNRDLAYFERYEKRLRGLTDDDINAAFRKYIDPKRLAVVTFGDLPETAGATNQRKPATAKSPAENR